MATLDATKPADGVSATKTDARAFKTSVKGRIENLPDALDSGGNEATALVGRHVRIGADGAEAGGDVDMDGGTLAGHRALFKAATTNTTIDSSNATDWDGRVWRNTSGGLITLTLDETIPTGFQARCLSKSGTLELAISGDAKPFVNGGQPVVLSEGESAQILVHEDCIEVHPGTSL